MLSGNKLVLMLPIILMIFLFISGGYYINKSKSVTNATLNEEVTWDAELHEIEEGGAILTGSWEWESSPEDGLEGTDYLGITLLDENDHPISTDVMHSYSMQLDMEEDEVVVDGEMVKNGILFSFNNEVKVNEIIGQKGSFKVRTNEGIVPKRAIISYLHTWKKHDGLKMKDARFFEREFVGKDKNDESFFWVAERFVDLEKGSLHSS